jgi:hypothetical protein
MAHPAIRPCLRVSNEPVFICCENFAPLLRHILALPSLYTLDDTSSDRKPVVWFRQNIVVFSFFWDTTG